MMNMNAKSTIELGKAILGIEFGSTRIKAVLIDQGKQANRTRAVTNGKTNSLTVFGPIASMLSGMVCKTAMPTLRKNVKEQYGTEIETLAAIGISAMMHGYMAFNDKEEILAPFRTWRNTNTAKAAAELSKLFNFNIPLRWSISHLYQAILNNEEHVKDIKFQTTLAGYIHWQLRSEKFSASAMHPV
jgi:sugar (pentulose or hexulose) kinase